jgi:AcrR family transcriptional regulator
MSSRPLRTPRSDSRLQGLLDVAASLFAQRGYAATSMRDIALGVKMLPGSLYYHFASKEELLVAVYEAGVRELDEAVPPPLKPGAEPWARLEAACTGAPADHPARQRLRAGADPRAARRTCRRWPNACAHCAAGYERLATRWWPPCPCPPRTDRHALRLMLLGALNWSRFWFEPQGRETPRGWHASSSGFLKRSTPCS